MNTKITILLFVLLGTFAYSQEKKIDTEISTYSVKIDSLISAEKKKMNAEMEIIDKNFEAGKISNDEKISSKRAIAEKYEKIINEKVEKENEALQNITKEIASNSVFKKNKDTLISSNEIAILGKNKGLISFSRSEKKDPRKALKSNELAVYYSFINLTKSSENFNPFDENSKMRVGNSHSFEIQSRRERQIGGYTSPVFIRYGLAYRSDTYMPKRPLVFVQNNEQLYLENFTQGTLKRSKLRNVYLTFPVDFQWVLNPKYTEYEGIKYLDNKRKQLRIGAGVYAGINLRNIVKVKYHNNSGNFDKYKYTLDYGVNSFLFGAKFSISYGGLSLFIKKDFTPIFNNHTLLPNKNGIQIGVDIVNLNF